MSCSKYFTALVILSCVGAVSCKHNSNSGELRADDDKPITRVAGTTSKIVPDSVLPGVVKLMRRLDADHVTLCTGTFISKRHLMTAGHCFANRDDKTLLLNGQASDRVYVSDNFPRDPEHDFAKDEYINADFAIMEFASDMVRDSDVISLGRADGEPVRLMGYGKNGSSAKDKEMGCANANQPGEKSDGTTTLSSKIDYAGVLRINATDSLACPGDSGGPVLNSKNELIGVIHGLTYDNTGFQVGYAVDVNSARVQAVLKKVSGLASPSSIPSSSDTPLAYRWGLNFYANSKYNGQALEIAGVAAGGPGASLHLENGSLVKLTPGDLIWFAAYGRTITPQNFFQEADRIKSTDDLDEFVRKIPRGLNKAKVYIGVIDASDLAKAASNSANARIAPVIAWTELVPVP